MTTTAEVLAKSLEEFKTALNKFRENLEPLAYGATKEKLPSMLRMYAMLDDIKGMGEGLAKVANIHMPELAELASKIMDADGTDKISLDGRTFAPTLKTYVSVSNDNKPLVMHWLKTHPLGKELVREDYNANAFTAFIKKMIEEEGYSKDASEPEKRIPNEVSTFDKPVLTMRRNKS